MRPQLAGGATPITPKNGINGKSRPHERRAFMASRSSGIISMRPFGNSSGNVPAKGRMRFQPQSCRSFTSSMCTSSTCPAFAPATATGPVRIWPGSILSELAWISRSSGGTWKPASGAGVWSDPPDTVSMMIVSPLAISMTGASDASKYPHAQVSGLAFRTAVTGILHPHIGGHRQADHLRLGNGINYVATGKAFQHRG
jgi:hypothetical protein